MDISEIHYFSQGIFKPAQRISFVVHAKMKGSAQLEAPRVIKADTFQSNLGHAFPLITCNRVTIRVKCGTGRNFPTALAVPELTYTHNYDEEVVRTLP